MAATLTQDRFSGREWMFERKFDGIRVAREWTCTASCGIRGCSAFRFDKNPRDVTREQP